MEALTIGVRHHTVGIAMNDDSWSLVLRSCLVDRQRERRTDIVTTELQTTEELDILTRIEGIIHLSHRVTLDGILNLIGHRHILELTLALSVTIEVETDLPENGCKGTNKLGNTQILV